MNEGTNTPLCLSLYFAASTKQHLVTTRVMIFQVIKLVIMAMFLQIQAKTLSSTNTTAAYTGSINRSNQTSCNISSGSTNCPLVTGSLVSDSIHETRHKSLNNTTGKLAEGRSLSKISPRVTDSLRRFPTSRQHPVHVAQDRFHPTDVHTNLQRPGKRKPGSNSFNSNSYVPQSSKPASPPQDSYMPPPPRKPNLPKDAFMPPSMKPALPQDSYMPQPPSPTSADDDSEKSPPDYYDDGFKNGDMKHENGPPPESVKFAMSSDSHSPPYKGHDHQPYDYNYFDYDHDHVPHKDHMEPTHDEERNKKPYSYYYIGRKLWYIPLYFSVYFIVYVTALLLKAIARHKIIYPIIHWAKDKRSIDSTAETVTRYLEKAILLYGYKT